MASSQKQHYEHGLKNSSFKTFRTTFEPFRKRKIQSGNLKISLSSELGAISDREISDVRQKMKAVHQNSVKIAQVKRSRLHSILFDNTGNKTDKKQILGVILDTCSHFIRKRSRNSRYITFSSNLNESRSFNQNESYETCISEGSESSFSSFRFKKINISFAALLVFALCFFVSCGGGSSKPENGGDSVSNFGKLSGECYPNKTCDEGLLCDTERNICVEDPENPINDSDKTDSGNPERPDSDSDNSDSIPDDGDTLSDGSDSQPDTDTTPDDGDSQPDSDNTGTTNDNPTNLPECSPTSATPCIDSEALDADSEKAYLIWSGKSPERLRWIDAVSYCQKLDEGGFNDWQLPTFAALKTLLRSGTYCELGGSSYCSKFGDIVSFWTATQGYCIDFYNRGQLTSKNVDENFDVRCVRKEITSRQVNCPELPENTQWNSVSEITQTWNWASLSWTPSRVSALSEEPSTTECRFKCKEGLFGSACNLTCEEFQARDNRLCKSDCSTCGCKAGYVWVDYSLDPWVQTSYPDKDYNNKCVACAELAPLASQLREGGGYCPGGDDFKGKRIVDGQIALCPEYTRPNDKLDDCVCELGVPPPPKEECYPHTTRKKPLIIKPKVNSSLK